MLKFKQKIRGGRRAKKHLTPEKRQRVGKLCSLSCAKRGEGSFPTTKWSEGEREGRGRGEDGGGGGELVLNNM